MTATLTDGLCCIHHAPLIVLEHVAVHESDGQLCWSPHLVTWRGRVRSVEQVRERRRREARHD